MLRDGSVEVPHATTGLIQRAPHNTVVERRRCQRQPREQRAARERRRRTSRTMFHFPTTRSPAASGASESPGNTPGAALKKRSLKADLSPGSWRHHRRDAFDPYELLAKYELTSDGVEAGGKRRPPVQRLRGWIILLLGIIVWIMVGSVLYATTNGWNFAQSLYFAVDDLLRGFWHRRWWLGEFR